LGVSTVFLAFDIQPSVMNIPGHLQYTKDHEWIKLEGSVATIGITDFAQSELGDIVFVDVSALGKELAAHDVFGTMEAVKTVSDLFMPVAGKVTEVNPLLDKNPEKVNQDPYGEGWLIKVEVSGPPNGLLSAEAYRALLGK
jgi:glycine cleavage system H protein